MLKNIFYMFIGGLITALLIVIIGVLKDIKNNQGIIISQISEIIPYDSEN